MFIKNGVELAKSLSIQIDQQKTSSRLNPSTVQQMDSVPIDNHSYGAEPLGSDVEEEEYPKEGIVCKQKLDRADELVFPSLMDEEDGTGLASGVDNNDEVDGIHWKANQPIPQPMKSNFGNKSKIIEKYLHMFTIELSSFLAFVPLEFWQLHLECSNIYGRHHFAKQE